MLIQRYCTVMRIFECTIVMYFFMQINALRTRDDEPLVQEFSRNENERGYVESGHRSPFNAETNFMSLNVQPSYWEPIFDGIIIAAIGSLFTKSIKDESNRERLERNKLRETLLLKNLTKLMNNPVQFDIIKRESKNALRYINQVV